MTEPQIEDVYVADIPGVLVTMRRWLNGEPVWPYAKILAEWGADFEMYRWRMPGPIDRSLSMMKLRQEYIREFGFAIPCAELLDELAKAERVVDVGAGTGYLTRLMRNRGIQVIGSDPRFGHGHVLKHGAYDHQQIVAQGKTMVRRHPDALIFCSWPSLDDTWFRQMLKAMRIGQRLVVIREDSCAEESAWQYLDDCFEEQAQIAIPAFLYMNDLCCVWIKTRQRALGGEARAEIEP